LQQELQTSLIDFRDKLYAYIKLGLQHVLDEDFYRYCAFLSPRFKLLAMITIHQQQDFSRKILRTLKTSAAATTG